MQTTTTTTKLTFPIALAALLLAGASFVFNGPEAAHAQVKMQPYPLGISRIEWDYDSGWVPIYPFDEVVNTHNLGGDPDDYFVVLTGRDDSDNSYHQANYGTSERLNGWNWGCMWLQCNSATIKVFRNWNDDSIPYQGQAWDYFRVRILKNQ